MAKATIIRRAVDAKPAVPEIKIEGVPYRAARAGAKADPGEVQLTCTVEEAQALATILYLGVCTGGGVNATGWVGEALLQAVGRGPFSWQPFKVTDERGHEKTGHGYLIRP